MKRLVPFALALVLLVGLAAPTPARAQERTVEVALGAQYPLLSRLIEADQDLGWHLRLGLRMKPRLWLNFTWETVSTRDDLGLHGDVDFDFYGVGTTFVLSGDQGFRLLALLNAGAGDITFDNPRAAEFSKPSDSPIDLWYEAGFGALFDGSDRFVFRLAITYRRVSPKHPNLVMDGSRGMFVPTFDVAYRF